MIFQKIKQNIIKIAINEGKLNLKGNKLKGGEEIEKYLAPFRKLFIKHNPKYLNPEQGFEWCCAYVYYIIRRASYDITIQPFKDSTMHLGSVEAWINWAIQKNRLQKSWQDIEARDLVIFDYLMGEDLDHIGIVTKVHDNYLLCSEGNFYNKSGIFKRVKDDKIWGHIKL